jgi:hypothetical protein
MSRIPYGAFSGFKDRKGISIDDYDVLFNPYWGDFWLVVLDGDKWLVRKIGTDDFMDLETVCHKLTKIGTIGGEWTGDDK